MKNWILLIIGVLGVASTCWVMSTTKESKSPARSSMTGDAGGGRRRHAPSPKVRASKRATLEPAAGAAGDLCGVVLDVAGQPVSEATVAIAARGSTAVSGANGEFCFHRLPSGVFVLQAELGNLRSAPRHMRPGDAYGAPWLQLLPEGSIEVRVMDAADAEPLADAAIHLAGRPASRTDATGRAVLADVEPGTHNVRVICDGYAAQQRVVRVLEPGGPPAQVTFALGRGAGLRAQVIDSEGRAANAADIQIWPHGGIRHQTSAPLARSVSDPAGLALITGLPVGVYAVEARHEAGEARQRVLLRAGEADQAVTLRLTALATLTGRVLDDRGDPIAGAQIRVRATSDGDTVAEARNANSDANGNFEVPNLGRQPVIAWAQAKEGRSPSVNLDLAQLKAPAWVELTIVAATTGISGHVVDEDGQPVPGVRVTGRPASNAIGDTAVGANAVSAIADERGAFALKGVEERTYSVFAQPHGMAKSRRRLQRPQHVRAPAADVRIVMASPGAVRGRVHLPGGEVPEAFAVYLDHEMVGHFALGTGEFEVLDVPAGSYEVVIAGDQFAPTSAGRRRVHANEEVDVGEIALHALRAVTGLVVDADGRPVAGARIVAAKQVLGDSWNAAATSEQADPFLSQTVSDGHGRFELPHASDGQVVIAEHADLGRSRPRLVGKEPIHLVVSGIGEVTGRVTLGDRPARGSSVVLAQLDTRGRPLTALMTQTDADGAYWFGSVPFGHHRLAVTVAGASRRFTGSGIVLTEDEPRVERDLVVPGGGINLEVSINSAVSGARASVLLLGPSFHATTVEHHATSQIAGVAPGDYQICVKGLDGKPDHEEKPELSCRPLTVAPQPADQHVAI